MTRDYRDLEVWQRAMELCESVYALLRRFPAEEKYALCDQLRRAVVSIPSNIAEGNGRASKTEYARFLAIARGSLFEVRTQLELSERLGYVKVSEETWMLIEGMSKMLYSLMSKLRQTETGNR
jgi:four helix bundle protein